MLGSPVLCRSIETAISVNCTDREERFDRLQAPTGTIEFAPMIESQPWMAEDAQEARPDRDGESEAADGTEGPEPAAGILGHLTDPLWTPVPRLTTCEKFS
jgi:hypothetical protein